MSLYSDHKFENSLFCTNRFPPLDFHESEKEYIVNAELPGVPKEQVNVDVQRRYGSFTRAITLPRNVKITDITAKFENGILEVKLPKDQSEKPSGRKIEIQ
ncbi:1678_t:CDS:2 [Dentiscutata erythropus]|uniref:1678_t:CDS:1 n=1 Tax=Dentiscutata erythropus TaxID=1348616 RepID=A0A9N9ESH5_9GLOM|nr:1678_t:CDS:2 [Dentiscutata erythropus]